ncbi:MAG: cupredoxin domain-containing protein [Thaumarchaeota archaeon]|nr:cupredoxin domain-containing protein [Candidatus Nitrosotalea sp.]MDE1872043.1 cupredoxin domain-containing protein [Nitrososphaerota archaeon]
MKTLHLAIIIGIILVSTTLSYLLTLHTDKVNLYITGIHTDTGLTYQDESKPPIILGRGYNDSSIHVSEGTMIELHFINKDTDNDIPMDLNLDAFNVHTNHLTSLQSQTVSFMADKSGTFTYYSKLHPEMKGTIIIDNNSFDIRSPFNK